MILKNYKEIKNEFFDVVIIGSGPAGMSIALELEKKNKRCLIIEAGKDTYDEFSQSFYKGKITGDKISELSSSRLRQLGGTSAIWGGWSKPLEDYTFNNWPIKKTDLDIYQKSTAEILKIKNIFRINKLSKNINQIEFQYSQVKFADQYISHLENSKKIFLLLNTQLSHFEGDNEIVEYAHCFQNQKKIKIRGKKFILACGGIENSRILLWTKDKNKNLLKDNSNIGKYWMTHAWILAGAGLIDEIELKKINKGFIDYEGAIHFATGSNFIRDKDLLSCGLYMSKNENKKFYKEIIKDILCLAPGYGKKIAKKVFNKDLKCGNIFMHVEDYANIQNEIKLDYQNKDAHNIPRVNLNYKVSKIAIKSAKLFLEDVANYFRKNDIGRIALKEELHDEQKFKQLGTYHHIGGTIMGTNIKNSVVNEDLRVHDIKNLYIVGSSTFPTSGYTNSTFAIIQLSLRLANKIINENI